MISKIWGYIAAAGAAALTLILAYSKGVSAQKNKVRVEQGKIELEAHKASQAAREDARGKTEANSEKADNNDWSGFNR